MDGLNFKLSGKLSEYFVVDSNGAYFPKPDLLNVRGMAEQVKRQLNHKTGFYDRVSSIVYNSDVRTSLNPYGNTPTLGAGIKLIGRRPLSAKVNSTADFLKKEAKDVEQTLQKRQEKIQHIQEELMGICDGLSGDLDSDAKTILHKVETDQVMTGGGFDGGQIGDVTKSALNFLVDGKTEDDGFDSELSKTIVECCLMVRDALKKEGLVEGSIKPYGASKVRALQDNDGMFGYPVYSAGNDALTKDLAVRLLLETGVDLRGFVGQEVVDSNTGVKYPYRVIDAAGHILDNKVFTYDDLKSLVTILVRTQKHGWKKDSDGSLIPKPAKVRSVYPNAFLPAVVEGMIFDPFNRKLQELKISFLPSLQDKPTRVDMITKQLHNALNRGYDFLAADWSKYDATVKGWILATVIQLVVKPFINADYYYWIDAATYILTYKYLLLDQSMCSINRDIFEEAKKARPYEVVSNYVLFGSIDGLISGAKFTHVGGSLYGEVVIHHAIPRILGYDPITGPQAGDDTLMAVPLSMIDLTSAEKTYDPICDAASKFGLKANASKQIWHQHKDELVKVFLQESYHAQSNVYGVGSIFRPASAVFYSEREKQLSVSEQLMAEIARMNQGADSPFADQVVEWWLSKERYLGWLFQNYGRSGFQKLIETIGVSGKDLLNRIDVGSFTFGVSKDDIEKGTLPILPVMERVASKMRFSSEDRASMFGDPNQGETEDASAEVDLD